MDNDRANQIRGVSLPKLETEESPHAPPRRPISPAMEAAAEFGGVIDPFGNPTAAERRTVRKAAKAVRRRRPPTLLSRAHGDDPQLTYGGELERHARLLGAFGTNSTPFMQRALFDLENMCARRGEVDDPNCTALNAALAIVAAIDPQNELEAALAVQMAGTHAVSNEMLGRVMRTTEIDRMAAHLGAATKLQRTFTAQLEALTRLRDKGQQTAPPAHGRRARHSSHHLKGRGRASAADGREREALSSPDSIGSSMSVPRNAKRAMQDARRPEHGRAPR